MMFGVSQKGAEQKQERQAQKAQIQRKKKEKREAKRAGGAAISAPRETEAHGEQPVRGTSEQSRLQTYV